MAKKAAKATLTADVKYSVATIIDVLAKDGKKPATDLIVAAGRETLDLYTKQIAGKAPHPSHDTEKVRAHLIRWAAGDKNWSYDDHRGNGTNHTDANGSIDTKGEDDVKKAEKKDAKKVATKKAEATKTKKETTGRTPAMAILGKKMPGKLHAKYKGTEYEAIVHGDGTIETEGGIFTSPSSAAKSITKKSVDGWIFWSCDVAGGKRVKIGTLRKPAG